MPITRHVPNKVICAHNKDKPWLGDECMRAFDPKQEAHLRWTVIALGLTLSYMHVQILHTIFL